MIASQDDMLGIVWHEGCEVNEGGIFHWRYFRVLVGRCSEDVDVGKAVLGAVE